MILLMLENSIDVSLLASLMEFWRDWRRKLRMFGMEMESFKEFKHTFGYGVDLHTDWIANRWEFFIEEFMFGVRVEEE